MEPKSTARHLAEPASTKGNLSAVLLTWDHCEELSRRLAPNERMECTAAGHTPAQALAGGLLFGLSWAVLRQEVLAPAWSDQQSVVGAFGFTQEGHIWSLWSRLERKEQLAILKLSREWIPYLVNLSGRPTLTNAVHFHNAKAIEWLKATGCMNIDTVNPRRNPDGSESYAFETQPVRTP